MADDDPRRRIPRTDALMAHPRVQAASATMSQPVVARVVRGVQDQARRGQIRPQDVETEVLAAVGELSPSSLRGVLNATGVIIHTNLGRAPLSPEARAAVAEASGYVDLELDLATGTRSRRGAAARAALLAACPEAQDALVVNNGAAALVLATTALAGGREVVLSRGEMIEIGAGFRLAELVASTGARLREVGSTNRTHLEDYARALGSQVGCVLKVHPSNYRISGFTSAVSTEALSELARSREVPLVVDVGSGLLTPDEALPDEPDITAALRAGAHVVVASGDKLLGGPQAGLLLGRAEVIAALARHPLARAVRADKLTLAALEATLNGAGTPVSDALHLDSCRLHQRTTVLADALGVPVVPHQGRVGGGGGAGVELSGWALQLPGWVTRPLRTGTPAVLGRVHGGACLVDLRCVPEGKDAAVLEALRRVLHDSSRTTADVSPGREG